ncbi:DUF4124 domain-containing protein [Psychrobacter sp. F1192]|uniref:DUF4124 domain-containing protein n=1 Tax=Psychrobacter coccoides TaxID=2818440 RepID=A0ABS3NL64_9GAMM|nr:DUF4124 domain-containing protein [Psychrobacter coccoides]MBO1530154.1 DUF4124 domain-containing protein [Psychrobacter coccoides]
MYPTCQTAIKNWPILPLNKHKLTGPWLGLVIGIASLCAPMVHAAPIYKVVDEKTGHVTFTDRPQNYEQKSGKHVSQTDVTSHHTASEPMPMTTSAAVTKSIESTSTTDIQSVNYQLTMTEPSEERAYRRPAQSIDVKLQIQPALQADDRVVIYLDDAEVAQGLSASIATVDIMPGAHSIQAIVKDKAEQTLAQVEQTVYVIQNTQTLQNNQKIAQQLLAYERLPWHQKLILKLQQKDNDEQKTEHSQPVTNDAFAKKVAR